MLPSMPAAPATGPGRVAWADAVRMMAAEVRNAGRAARLDILNVQYGMHRNLAAALAIVAIADAAIAPAPVEHRTVRRGPGGPCRGADAPVRDVLRTRARLEFLPVA